jgi:hypothetical protein
MGAIGTEAKLIDEGVRECGGEPECEVLIAKI